MGILNFTTEKINEILSDSVTHFSDTVKHITAAERTAWNGKASGTHASQHASIGSDPITPASIGAVPARDLVPESEFVEPDSFTSDVFSFGYGITYHKTADGIVHFQGAIDASSLAAGYNQILTLPAGFRPKWQVHAPALIYDNRGSAPFLDLGKLYVSQTGFAALQSQSAYSSAKLISFAISFPAYS